LRAPTTAAIAAVHGVIANMPDTGDAETMIEGPEAAHHHTASGIRWFDAITTLSVLMVSIASVVISLHTGSTMDNLVHENARLVRANSTPLLNFGTGNITDDGHPQISFTVTNSGTGPARVVWFQISDKGVAQHSILDIVQSLGHALPIAQVQTSPLARTLIRASEERTVMRWPKPTVEGAELEAWRTLDKARFGLKIEACYCSLLGECWHSTLDGDIPHPVPVCTADGRISFNEIPKGKY
jgi:hypothetical protein